MQTGLTTTTRSREPSGNRAIAVSGRQPLPAPEQETTKAFFPFPRCKGRRNRTLNGENETGYSTKTRQFFLWKSKPASTISTSTSPIWNAASRSTTGALGLKEISRKQADDGSFILAYLGDGETGFRLELTWLRDHAATPYELGENESHLCVRVAGDYEAVRAYHKELGCVCFENHEMGLYFINDPDDYWIEVLP